MNSSDAFRASRLVWRFKKSGGNGRDFRTIADLDENARHRLSTLALLEEAEEPALGLFHSDTDWILITSRRVVWTRGAKRYDVPLSDLSDATVDVLTLRAAGRKDRVETLTIVTSRGERHEIILEQGPPLSGAWNALKMAAAWNKP